MKKNKEEKTLIDMENMEIDKIIITIIDIIIKDKVNIWIQMLMQI